MGSSRRQFSKEFKLAAVKRLEQGVSIVEAARALEVNPNVSHRWRREFRQGPGMLSQGMGRSAGRTAGSLNCNARLAQQALEIDSLKGCLQRVEEQRMLQASTGNPPSTKGSGKK